MHRIATSFFLSLLTLGAPAAMAEEGPAKDQFLLSLLGGWYEEPNELDLTNGDEGLGGGLGYAITDKWIAEALYFGFKPEAEVGGVKGKAEMDYWSINLMRTLGPGKHWKPYVAIGGGRGVPGKGGGGSDRGSTKAANLASPASRFWDTTSLSRTLPAEGEEEYEVSRRSMASGEALRTRLRACPGFGRVPRVEA